MGTAVSGTRKIKKFKVRLRPRESFWKLRRQMATSALDSVQWPELIKEEIEKVSLLISPSVVYDTLDKNEARVILVNSHQELGKRILMISFLTATIGEKFTPELIGAQDELKQKIWQILAEEALEQTVNFAGKLILEEAKKDSCQLLPQIAVRHTAELSNIIASLSADKIQVRMEAGRLSPHFSAVSYCLWVPQGKSSPSLRKA
ncbi:MAG: hypothetical protein ABII74_00950 [Elusimicrobiota bacterium]